MTTTQATPRNREERRHPEKLLDRAGVAERLCVSERLVRKLTETRQIESVKVGDLVRYEADAVDRYVERNRRPAVGV
jgi:excisionase family DNA binding protein